jgi:hypothetical protein
MEIIDSILFLFVYSNALRPLYVTFIALGLVLGIVLFVKHPFFEIAHGKSPKQKWAKLAVIAVLIAFAFGSLQHHKVLQFEESARCESLEDNVLYLPLWVDATLAPYLAETYQHYSSDCSALAARIATARSGWSRHLTIGLHLLLSFLMMTAFTVCLVNFSSLVKKSGADE